MSLGKIESLLMYGPELSLAVTVIALLFIDLLIRPVNRLRVSTFIALVGTLVSAFFTFNMMSQAKAYLFESMVTFDPFANFFKMIILLATLVVILISSKDSETNRRSQGEYFALLLSMALGGFVLVSSNNLLMVYLSLELISLVSYVLAGFMKGNRKSSEASMKYVIYGGVSSGAMIYGMSFLYGLTGSFDFSVIAQTLQLMPLTPALGLTLFVSSLLVLVGLGYKIACVPFHMWCPDVYEGSPTPITAYFSVVPKVAGFGVLVRFFYGALSMPGSNGVSWVPIQNVEWPFLIAAISIATMTLGNLVALHQNSLKRLLAYSSIAHAGYMLMAFVVLTQEAVTAILFYLAVYLFMNLGAFLVVILVRDATGSDDIKCFKGLGWKGGSATFMAVCMAVFLFSLTGLPPTAGFIGKVYLFAAVIKGGWYLLGVVGVLNSVVSLYYYVRVIKVMFFEKDSESSKFPTSFQLEPMHFALVLVFAFFTLLFGLYWSPLIEHSVQSIAFLSGN